jgi:hypothetical protein
VVPPLAQVAAEAESLPWWVQALGIIAALIVPACNAAVAVFYRPPRPGARGRTRRERALEAALEAARVELQVILQDRAMQLDRRETAEPPAGAAPPPPPREDRP